MVAIITNHGDFDIAITFAELDKWSETRPIEGELLGEGEESIGKKIEIAFQPNAEELVNCHYDGDDWNQVSKITWTLNQRAFNLVHEGRLLAGTIQVDIHLQVSDALG